MNIEDLKKIPNFPHAFEGFPEYEGKLARRCAHTGEPCSRSECNKWVEASIEVPNPLHPATRERITLHQCQDDQVVEMLSVLTTILTGFIQQMAAIARQQPSGIPRGGSPNLNDILKGRG